MFYSLKEKENIEELIKFLYEGPDSKCFNSVIQLKNLAIGSNRQKENVINSNIVPHLLQLLVEEIENEQLLYEIGALLCTLSKGTPNHVRYMIDLDAIQTLIKKINHPNTSRPIVEICLRTLRSLFQSDYAPIETIYETHLSGVPFIAYLLNMIAKSKDQLSEKSRLHNYSNISTDNWHIQECILNILASSCRTPKQQNVLCMYSTISTISDLLLCDSVRVSKAGLNLPARICHNNKEVSKIALETRSKSLITNYEIELMELLYNLLDRNETQLYAARCFTNLFRSEVLSLTCKRHEEYIYKSLKVLVRLCKKENHPLDRIDAAETLSYLYEMNSDLQKLASICDHLIASLADYLTFNMDTVNGNLNDVSNIYLLKEYKKEELESRMKEAAFICFSSLASTDEEVRKKIIDTESLMLIVVNSLGDDSNQNVKLGALRCLHSLSRSIRQLQTAFQEHLVWQPLKSVLFKTTDNSILSVVSLILCNLLLDSSPSKPQLLDRKVIEILCALTRKGEHELRLNGTDQIFTLLRDPHLGIVLKTLGLLRNMLAVDVQIDTIMAEYGEQIMEIIMLCLNDRLQVENSENEVKEEALCILANIDHGERSKDYVISNDELLRKLHSFLMQPEFEKLQLCAVLCVKNLIRPNGKDANERKAKLKQLGCMKGLKELLNRPNHELYDKAKGALAMFQSKDLSN